MYAVVEDAHTTQHIVQVAVAEPIGVDRTLARHGRISQRSQLTALRIAHQLLKQSDKLQVWLAVSENRVFAKADNLTHLNAPILR